VFLFLVVAKASPPMASTSCWLRFNCRIGILHVQVDPRRLNANLRVFTFSEGVTMSIIDVLEQARELSWQYCCKVVVVLDLVASAFRVFTQPHAEYLKQQPMRYVVLKTYRDGIAE
jgi:hypothetical protein